MPQPLYVCQLPDIIFICTGHLVNTNIAVTYSIETKTPLRRARNKVLSIIELTAEAAKC